MATIRETKVLNSASEECSGGNGRTPLKACACDRKTAQVPAKAQLAAPGEGGEGGRELGRYGDKPVDKPTRQR